MSRSTHPNRATNLGRAVVSHLIGVFDIAAVERPVLNRIAVHTAILAYAGVLVPASMVPSVVGTAGILYFFGAMMLGLAQLQVAIWASRLKTNDSARWLMHATVIYLPVLLGLLMWDKAAR